MFVFDVANPANGTPLRCDNCFFNFWEKNWMPFSHSEDGRLLAVRWFSPHTIVEVEPRSGRVRRAAFHASHGTQPIRVPYPL